MFRKKLKFQILFSVLTILVCGILALYFLSNNEIKKIINKQQTAFYTEKIETILQTLDARYQKLQKTQLADSYEYSFKEFARKEIKKVHYNETLEVYPFMLNEKRIFILHPTLNKDNFQIYSNLESYKKVVNEKEGNFYIQYQGIDKWIIFKQFKQWDWIVGYSMPISIKYEAIQYFYTEVFSYNFTYIISYFHINNIDC